MEATELVEFLVGSYPRVCLFRSKGQMLVEVKGCLFCYLLCGSLFHPDVDDFRLHFIGRHNHRCKNLTFTDIFFP